MTQASVITGKYPKSVRLLKHKDFKFADFREFAGANFFFIYCRSQQTRIGISLSKKVLRKSSSRNRVKRLIKETFRLKIIELAGVSIHVVGRGCLQQNWLKLKKGDVDREFEGFIKAIRKDGF